MVKKYLRPNTAALYSTIINPKGTQQKARLKSAKIHKQELIYLN